jgi:hypothetical protein
MKKVVARIHICHPNKFTLHGTDNHEHNLSPWHVQTGPELRKQCGRQLLGEDVDVL